MIKDELPFERNTAHRLMAIAENENLRDVAHGPHLPAAWRTLYELTKLTDEQFADGIKTKLINPKMERKAIDDLRVVCRKNAKALKLINEEIGPLAHHGTNQFGGDNNVMSSAVQGNSPTYTLRRLKRDRPRHCEDAGRTSSTATAHVLRNE